MSDLARDDDDFALLCDAVDVTTKELYDHAIARLDVQVRLAHETFDAIASGDVVIGTITKPHKRNRKRRSPREKGYTAT
jgi:hypothetical protein